MTLGNIIITTNKKEHDDFRHARNKSLAHL